MKTNEMTLTATMSALIFIATFVPKIPIPLGYAHLGDAAIFLTVILCGRKIGILSGVIGSALADLLSGFPIWILPTILIKSVMVEIFFRLRNKNILLALVVASFFMTLGYTFAGGILYDSLSAGVASTPGLLLKSAINIFITIVVSVTMKAKGIKI